MKTYPRSDRVGEQIHRVLAQVLRRDIHDPRLEAVTVTQVRMSPDLREAHVYFTLSGKKTSSEMALAGFTKAMGFIKKAVAKEVGLRYMPNLRFSYDTTLDRASRIDQLLKEEHVSGDLDSE